MPHPLLFRHGTSTPEELQASGVYVGSGYRSIPMQPERADVTFQDGDLLILTSDGILESRDKRGRQFGPSGIITVVTEHRHHPPAQIAEAILRAVAQHAQKAIPMDDQTVVVVGLGQSAQNRPVLEAFEDGVRLHNAGPATAAARPHLQELLESHARQSGVTAPARIRQICTATWEAIQNAIHYGSAAGETIRIRFLPPDVEGRLGIELRQPRPWPASEEHLGRRCKAAVDAGSFQLGGAVIMLWLADRVDVSDGGRCVTLWFAPTVKPPRPVRFPDDPALCLEPNAPGATDSARP
jgi:hypothetical protein